MSEIDRNTLIAHLESMSDEDDEKALSSARQAAGLVLDAGLSWNDVLAPENTEEEEDEAEEPKLNLSDIPDDEAKLVDTLLARSDLNDDTRDDLETFKEDIEKGEFAAEDRKYLKALVARLGGKAD